ncbi:TPA: YPDG domain-containing protein, partial [Streptococcus suis]
MSNRDKNMFRQEQRFSFRKYSFGLASALIANVVFGATIAGGPLVHANTEAETVPVESSTSGQTESVANTEVTLATEPVEVPVERQVTLSYTVKVIDTEGTVLKTEVRTDDVTAGEGLASSIVELGQDLIPADYKLVEGLGQVRVVENQDNVFTVTVEKVVAKQISETPTATASENAISSEVSVTETSETAISSEASSTEISLASSEAPVEVITSSETPVAPASVKVTESVATNTSNLSSLALLAYEVHYTDPEGQVVGKTAGLVTAESKDGVATKQVNFTAKDVPAGYELAPGQSQVLTKQLVENQINILSFAVVKKSEEEEIAESQLAHKDVLEQVTSEADLLADEALRQVATSQAGNTALETAATATKEVVAEAQVVLKDASATQETVDAQVETVKASTKALADEMLKVDEDGVLTAQLAVSSTNSATVSTNATYNVSFYEDMHSRVPDFVRVSNITVNGQTITYEVIINESNSSGYGKAYHEFALGNEVDTTSVTIVRQQRSDSTSAWVNDGSWNAGTWVGGQRQYFSRSNGNILGALYPYNNARDNTTGAEVDAANINAQVGTLYRDQLDVTTRAYKYIITATARDGKNPANMAFMAGFRAGTDNRAYYVATPGVTDPVDQPTQASDKQEIFVFQDTPIKTVNAGTAVPNNTDKVKIGTITDADVIQSITVTDGDSLGYSVDTDGNAYGTPNGPNGLGSYKRALNVTDKKGNTTEVFSRASGSDDRYVTYILSATADSNAIVFNNGQSADARKQAVLDKVVVGSGTASSVVEAGDKKYKKYIVDPATGQEVPLPTAAGDHTVTVRVVTASNVYKDVPVTITNPTNRPPVVTPITDETNVNVDGEKSQAIYVFGINQGSTEDSNGATGTSPVADKNKATRKVAEISDPDGTISTIQYHDLRNTVPDLASGQGSTPALTVSKDGYLEGKLIYGPGAKSTRRLDVTDNGGAKTESTSFKILGYTDKLANTTAIEKAFGARPTTQEIFSKLTIDVNSSYPNAYPADLEIPADQYTREVVGYRTITTSNGTETKGDLTTATADTLPTSGSYEVKVKTKNVYGQEIFNWVRVNHAENTPTTATDKQTLYVFNNTPIATVGADSNEADGVNKVKVATLTDPEGIKSVAVGDGGLGDKYQVDTEGYASGTPSVSALGKHGRSLVVTDNQDQVTNVLTDNDKQTTYVIDASVSGSLDKAKGEKVTEQEILDKVVIDPGNENAVINDVADPKYRKVLAPGQTVPTQPGTHTVTVRVITDSNVYKDVDVQVIIPTVTVDPVDISDFEAGDTSVVLTPRSETDQIFVGVKGQAVKLVRQDDGTYVAEQNDANVTVATGDNGTITLTLPTGEKFAEGDRVVTRGENKAAYANDGFVKSSEIEKFATADTTAPEAPTVKANDDGSVTVTPSTTAGDDTKTVEITYTDEDGTTQTVTVTKGDDGTWSVPADSGVTVDETTGTVTIPAESVKANTPVTAVAKDEANNPSSPSTAIARVLVDPVDIADFEAGDTSVVLTPRSKTDQIFVGVKGQAVKLVRQDDGTYVAEQNDANVTVSTDVNGAITLTLPTGEKFAEGDRVVTRGENAASYENDGFVKSSELEKFATADTTAPEAPTVKANDDGSVTVTPSTTAGDDTKTVEITYTDEDGTTQTVTVTKGDDGTWSVPADSGVTVDETTGTVTIPSDKVQDGSTVSAVSKDEAGNTSSPSTDKAKKDLEITDNTTPTYGEKTVVPGTPATSTPVFTDASGQPITAPAGATYTIPADFQAPAGYTASIDPNTGVVTVTAADGTTVDSISVPVTVTYSDGSTDTTTAVFKLDTDGDGQPDVTDTDDDGDGIPDTQDNNPKTATTSAVTVNDATVVAGQPITPIPVTV